MKTTINERKYFQQVHRIAAAKTIEFSCEQFISNWNCTNVRALHS